MARSQSAILSVENKKALREEGKSLRVQLREAKSAVKAAERALKSSTRTLVRLEAQIEKTSGKLAADKAARGG